MECIFTIKPHECTVCVESRLFNCVQNKHHLVLTESGKSRIRVYLETVVESPERYKIVPGNSQRKGG